MEKIVTVEDRSSGSPGESWFRAIGRNECLYPSMVGGTLNSGDSAFQLVIAARCGGNFSEGKRAQEVIIADLHQLKVSASTETLDTKLFY